MNNDPTRKLQTGSEPRGFREADERTPFRELRKPAGEITDGINKTTFGSTHIFRFSSEIHNMTRAIDDFLWNPNTRIIQDGIDLWKAVSPSLASYLDEQSRKQVMPFRSTQADEQINKDQFLYLLSPIGGYNRVVTMLWGINGKEEDEKKHLPTAYHRLYYTIILWALSHKLAICLAQKFRGAREGDHGQRTAPRTLDSQGEQGNPSFEGLSVTSPVEVLHAEPLDEETTSNLTSAQREFRKFWNKRIESVLRNRQKPTLEYLPPDCSTRPYGGDVFQQLEQIYIGTYGSPFHGPEIYEFEHGRLPGLPECKLPHPVGIYRAVILDPEWKSFEAIFDDWNRLLNAQPCDGSDFTPKSIISLVESKFPKETWPKICYGGREFSESKAALTNWWFDTPVLS